MSDDKKNSPSKKTETEENVFIPEEPKLSVTKKNLS